MTASSGLNMPYWFQTRSLERRKQEADPEVHKLMTLYTVDAEGKNLGEVETG